MISLISEWISAFRIRELDRELDSYRTIVRTEPEAASTVGKWIAESNQERRRLETMLGKKSTARLTAENIKAPVWAYGSGIPGTPTSSLTSPGPAKIGGPSEKFVTNMLWRSPVPVPNARLAGKSSPSARVAIVSVDDPSGAIFTIRL